MDYDVLWLIDMMRCIMVVLGINLSMREDKVDCDVLWLIDMMRLF